MAGKLTVQQQRDRRAKIMLAVLGVVLLGVVALQLPKFMHSGGGGGTPSAAPSTTTPTSPTALVSAPATGQLQQFSRFAPKNPFRSQVAQQTTGPTSTTPATATPTAAAASKPKPKKSTPSPITISVRQQPAVPLGPRVPAALLLINGKKRVVPLDGAYPTKHPLFKVVALGGNALWIQLIGGSLANGSQTIKLERRRRVTLENATVGMKMVLTLIRPTTAPKPVLPPTTTTPAPVVTPTPTTTSTTPTLATSG